MLHSSTVENYLKAIYQGQMALAAAQDLVPMGQLAATLGVVPGTATTMVKTLADSGLVVYEPYSGVRLTASGEKLAAMVLRRHRLVELFLVRVMRMSWIEVHEEAEKLEHVVSERLIERMDEMLGHPQVDPHGDPIPGPEGTVERHEYHTLLTCPLNTPLTITRVVDQDAAFLRFIESSELMPGESVQVEARDAAADSVRIRGKGDRQVTMGARAASKLLVEIAQVVLALLLSTHVAAAQGRAAPASSRPFEIRDNSFLIEEAFNQEPRIFQNIFNFVRLEDSRWEAVFTQEWPIITQKHQFSYTLPFASLDGRTSISDVLINYRYQASTEGPGRPAVAPRLSVIVPSGRRTRCRLSPAEPDVILCEEGAGTGVVGWQVNVPISKQQGDIDLHWNAGLTYHPGVDSFPLDTPVTPQRASKVGLLTPHLAASAIWRVHPMINVLFETAARFEESVFGLGSTTRETNVTISPGLRGGWSIGDQQVIIGGALPVSFRGGDTEVAVLGYFSYERPFKK